MTPSAGIKTLQATSSLFWKPQKKTQGNWTNPGKCPWHLQRLHKFKFKQAGSCDANWSRTCSAFWDILASMPNRGCYKMKNWLKNGITHLFWVCIGTISCQSAFEVVRKQNMYFSLPSCVQQKKKSQVLGLCDLGSVPFPSFRAIDSKLYDFRKIKDWHQVCMAQAGLILLYG